MVDAGEDCVEDVVVVEAEVVVVVDLEVDLLLIITELIIPVLQDTLYI